MQKNKEEEEEKEGGREDGGKEGARGTGGEETKGKLIYKYPRLTKNPRRERIKVVIGLLQNV